MEALVSKVKSIFSSNQDNPIIEKLELGKVPRKVAINFENWELDKTRYNAQEEKNKVSFGIKEKSEPNFPILYASAPPFSGGNYKELLSKPTAEELDENRAMLHPIIQARLATGSNLENTKVKEVESSDWEWYTPYLSKPKNIQRTIVVEPDNLMIDRRSDTVRHFMDNYEMENYEAPLVSLAKKDGLFNSYLLGHVDTRFINELLLSENRAIEWTEALLNTSTSFSASVIFIMGDMVYIIKTNQVLYPIPVNLFKFNLTKPKFNLRLIQAFPQNVDFTLSTDLFPNPLELKLNLGIDINLDQFEYKDFLESECVFLDLEFDSAINKVIYFQMGYNGKYFGTSDIKEIKRLGLSVLTYSGIIIGFDIVGDLRVLAKYLEVAVPGNLQLLDVKVFSLIFCHTSSLEWLIKKLVTPFYQKYNTVQRKKRIDQQLSSSDKIRSLEELQMLSSAYKILHAKFSACLIEHFKSLKVPFNPDVMFHSGLL
jgi:hypothetical protein